jgi:hypothetical protein
MDLISLCIWTFLLGTNAAVASETKGFLQWDPDHREWVPPSKGSVRSPSAPMSDASVLGLLKEDQQTPYRRPAGAPIGRSADQIADGWGGLDYTMQSPDAPQARLHIRTLAPGENASTGHRVAERVVTTFEPKVRPDGNRLRIIVDEFEGRKVARAEGWHVSNSGVQNGIVYFNAGNQAFRFDMPNKRFAVNTPYGWETARVEQIGQRVEKVEVPAMLTSSQIHHVMGRLDERQKPLDAQAAERAAGKAADRQRFREISAGPRRPQEAMARDLAELPDRLDRIDNGLFWKKNPVVGPLMARSAEIEARGLNWLARLAYTPMIQDGTPHEYLPPPGLSERIRNLRQWRYHNPNGVRDPMVLARAQRRIDRMGGLPPSGGPTSDKVYEARRLLDEHRRITEQIDAAKGEERRRMPYAPAPAPRPPKEESEWIKSINQSREAIKSWHPVPAQNPSPGRR